jgi:signal transduction histidine kinase
MKRGFRLAGPPLALQILALMVGGLLVAQLVTLALTLALPPAPAAQYGIDDIAATLAGASDGGKAKGLQRHIQSGPPDLTGAGWLVSEHSRAELARRMGVEKSRVSLAFYTPLPFAGIAAPRTLAMANDGFAVPGSSPFKLSNFLIPTQTGMTKERRAARLLRIQYGPMGAAAAPPAGFSAGFGTAPPIGTGATPQGAIPTGPFHRGTGADAGHPPFAFPRSMTRLERMHGVLSVDGGGDKSGAAVRLPDYGGANAAAMLRGSGVQTGPSAAAAQPQKTQSAATALLQRAEQIDAGRVVPPTLLQAGAIPRSPNLTIAPRGNRSPALTEADAAPLVTAVLPTSRAPTPRPQAAAPAHTTDVPPPPLPSLALPDVETPKSAPRTEQVHPSGPPIGIAPERRALFGFAPAPYVEGDFVAALQLGDHRWAVVQPAPEPFPNAWQRRILLWFVLALALVAPIGWLFARRLVKPIDRFAGAAEALGRDPAAAIGALDGPAEIGRAAYAFNLMQNRLRAFVDDRTAMVGAISHDLRTPLTRMRFRIEDVGDEETREGLLEEVDEMEAMIAQVINFIRDASAPAARERLDLGSLVEDVVEDARMVGGDVRVERADRAQVEVDVLGMKRLFDNLLENAVKYGMRARVRLRTDLDEVVAEILDDGPGLPEEEMERVFEPFYRSDTARASDKAGSGLGLAVCRSIARAHGGDVRLRQTADGFAAELRIPLAYGREKALA